MTDDPKYTDTEEYQKEIAEQYKRRVVKFDNEEIINSLKILGFDNIKVSDLTTTTAGNMNATYLTPNLVVKVNKGERPNYLSNKMVSDRLAGKSLVVKVLAYDYFDKTPFEILVMERAPGDSLLNDIFEFSEDEVKDLFRQVLTVINRMCEIKFDSFGWMNLEGKKFFPSFAEFLTYEFKINAQKVRDEKLCKPEDVDKVEAYFLKHVSVFNTSEKPTIMHRDLHMGNFLHEGTKLTAIIDFDWSMKGPKCGNLVSLLGFIDNPSQYTEGSEYFAKYKGKNFRYLLPVLKEELKDIFADKDLIRKLNLLFISDGIKWIGENWSAQWNADMIKGLLENEMPENDEGLNNTYPAKVLNSFTL